jgi:hypothetical protein
MKIKLLKEMVAKTINESYTLYNLYDDNNWQFPSSQDFLKKGLKLGFKKSDLNKAIEMYNNDEPDSIIDSFLKSVKVNR